MFTVASSSGLRGDYERAGADFVVRQDMRRYGARDHALWRTLRHRQRRLIGDYACDEFIAGVDALNAADGVPDLGRASDALEARTGWRLAPVPGFIPDDAFFRLLARRRFPVTVWLRRPDEVDYLVEPDIFHDFFGHVPMLANARFANWMQRYGDKGQEALAHGGLRCLARFYWYVVEFGLVQTGAGLRALGAGILSSRAETPHAVESSAPHRVAFDLERVMRTDYRIDDMQRVYFVLDDLEQLFAATRSDFRPIYRRWAEAPPLDPGRLHQGDRVISLGAAQTRSASG